VILEQNDEEAARWYLSAANLGTPGALHCLGVMYEEGRGVARNYEEAANCHHLADKLFPIGGKDVIATITKSTLADMGVR